MERLDELHRKNYVIFQDTEKFCFGTDAVLLSSFVTMQKNANVLDLGTGNAIIPILLCARHNSGHITGLEIQKDSVVLAQKSIEKNLLEDRISIVEGDIKNVPTIFKGRKFDVVVSNPPYMKGQDINAQDAKAIARHEILCTLEDVVKAAFYVLKSAGSFFMVYRPERVVDALAVLRENKLEPKIIRFVHANVDKEPKLVLIKAVKGGKMGCNVLAPLIMYNSDGALTAEAYQIYYGEA